MPKKPYTTKTTLNRTQINQLKFSLPVQAELDDRAEVIADKQRDRAPVRTGNLRDSITVERDGFKRRIGPTAFYGGLVEFDHLSKDGEIVKGQPYIRPSVG